MEGCLFSFLVALRNMQQTIP